MDSRTPRKYKQCLLCECVGECLIDGLTSALTATEARAREAEKALKEIKEDCETVARDETITIAERRTWRVIAIKCKHAIDAALARGEQGREG